MPKITVAQCHCGHGSDCHAASESGIHECQDCSCQSFHATGNRIAPQDPPRHWASGKTMDAQAKETKAYWDFIRKTAKEVEGWPSWKKGQN